MRHAFTLIELILVLAILAAATGLAVPTYQAFVTSNEIVEASQSVETAFEETRLAAIRTGQIQAIRFNVGDRTATIQPWLSTGDAANASAGATVITASGQAAATDATGAIASVGVSANQITLKESVTFSEAQVLGDMRSTLQVGTTAMAVASSTGESNPVMFYPDGSTSTARVVVQNKKGRRIAIELRGVTGSTDVVELVPNLSAAQ